MFFRRPFDAGLVLGAVVVTLGCESLIGATFGDYEKAATDGTTTGGASGRGGAPRGGTSGEGTAGVVTGGTGVLTGGTSAATGGSSAGDGGAAGAGGEPPCEPTGPKRRFHASVLAAGDNHTCAAIESTGELRCFGDNARGQLGLGHTRSVGADECEPSSTPSVDLGTYRTVWTIAGAAVALGGAHTCVLLDNRKVKCWGDNEYGQLGLNDTEARGDEPGEMGDALPYVDLGGDYTAHGLYAGLHHTCALIEVAQDNVELKCWGSNVSGQLGAGRSDAAIGDDAGEMATLTAVDFDPLIMVGLHARALALGDGHTCAVSTIGTVKCWGDNEFGQLGLGSTRPLVGTSPADMGQNLPQVDVGNRQVSTVTAGATHTCVQLSGSATCWGRNESGQLGLGHTRDIGRNSADMGTGLSLLTLSDDPGVFIGLLDAGSSHTCAVLNDPVGISEERTIKCWGGNDRGQLGLGDRLSRGDEMGELGGALDNVPVEPSVLPVAGAFHSCALFASFDAVCWGDNDHGQLGRGAPTDPLGDMVGEVEALTPIDLGGP